MSTKIWTLWSGGRTNEEERLLLKRPSAELPAPFGDREKREIKTIIAAFLERDDALGLAAPQIGLSRKIIIFKTRGLHERSPVRSRSDYEVLINPRITQKRGPEEIMSEGCLSCPDISVEVIRSTEIKVRALDEEGNKINRRYTGFQARIVQHEIDHLEGKLILDHADGAIYIPKEKRVILMALLQRELPIEEREIVPA
ncbi:MAG: peptide deformylase [Syntrophales bacterium]|nr:peptide deformylase [Syntrophales bacterium]MDD5532116.1 peptide deformylase [Syntrophales bacterium]